MAVAAQGADAAFTLAPCTGSAVGGNGSTLQGVAQTYFSTHPYSEVTCPGGPTVTYNAVGGNATGSGAGRATMGSLDGNRDSSVNNAAHNRFAGSDEPPTPTEQGFMNSGPTASTADDAKIHVIPVAAAAITVVVRVPAACYTAGVLQIPAGDLDSTGRIKITDAQLVGIFHYDPGFRTWGDLFPDIPAGDTACSGTIIHRVVRKDSSGSTFALKSFLNHVAGSTEFAVDAVGNQAWANDDSHPDTGACGATQTLCRSASTGGGALRTELLGTTGSPITQADGGIGYLALPDARTQFDFDPTAADSTATPPLTPDQNYWIQVEAVGTSTYYDADANANGYRTTANADTGVALVANQGAKGSNCQTTTFSNIPTGADPTVADWSAVDGTGSTTGYPICTLTYDLAFDDDAPAYANTAAEQSKARTVKDYLGTAVGIGQAGLFSNDYDALPNTALPGRPGVSLATIAQGGVNAIGWNKSADQSGGGGTTTTVTTPPPVTTTATVIAPPPIVTPPSNKFSVTSAKVSSTKKLVLSLQLPGPGKLSVTATAKYKGKTVKVATKSATVGGGKGSVTLSPSSATTSTLKKLASSSSLSVSISITFTPTGGTAAKHSATLKLKGTKPKAKKKK